MAKIDWLRYLGLGAGAAAMPAIINSVDFLSGIMASNILAYNLMGITVGGVVAASAGVLAVDQLLFKGG